MKKAYAVRRTVPPSAEIEAQIEAQIEQLLAVGVGDGGPRESLWELARLGAGLIRRSHCRRR
jgi:hypothetical protein